ncbi:MAG: hypothetical protein U0263_38445 [Polyangiaceae bacterium]
MILVDGLRYDFATSDERAPQPGAFAARAFERRGVGGPNHHSAAVLSFGTGTRGNFSQIVLNVHARRTSANHLFENRQDRRPEHGLIGDPVWKQAYGPFDRERLSPVDPMLEIDDSAELDRVAREWQEAGPLPNVLVLHFFAHDHQGHAFGIYSALPRLSHSPVRSNPQRYLDGLPKDTTVFCSRTTGRLRQRQPWGRPGP